MEHQSTQVSSSVSPEEPDQILLEAIPSFTPELSSRQQTSSQDVQKLYRKFRRAALESTARELQRKVQSHADASVEPAGRLSSETLLPRSEADPNRFDFNLNRIPQVEFLGLRFHRMTQDRAVDTLLSLPGTDNTYRVYFANAHSIEAAYRNPKLHQALKRSNLLFADGSGVLLGSRLTGQPLIHNLNGTDLVPALCKAASANPRLSVYFLGARPGVAQQAAVNLANRYPGLQIAGVQDGFFAQEDTALVLSNIRAAKPDFLLVAMGTPLQEIWIDRHANQLPGIVCIAVGGLFDFMAGRVPRAPRIIRHLGIEWIWRLMMEPSRLWKRYTIGNLLYLSVLFQNLFSKRRKKSRGA